MRKRHVPAYSFEFSKVFSMLIDLKHLREEYSSSSLELTDAPAKPIELFEQWMQEALQAKLPEPNAMTLATCKPDGFPSARVVLLKGLSE